VIGKELKCRPSSPEVIVAQIDRDAVKPGTNISGNPGMMTKAPEEDFLRDILSVVHMTEYSPGCAQYSLFMITHNPFEITHK